MTTTGVRQDEIWKDLRKALGMQPGEAGARSFWDDLVGSGEGQGGMFFDAEGNDRTPLVKVLASRVDDLTRTVDALSDRLAVVERIVVTDEAQLAEEIEKLRGERKSI